MQLIDLTNSYRTLLLLGAGGVGKTTTSLSLAIEAANRGKKVGLISIDPAKRLAGAMGLGLNSRLTRIELPPNVCKGELWAAMLDQKSVFDSMVKKYTTNEEIQQKIFTNQIYQAISGNLGGPLEYMALAKLNEMYTQDFDLIIIDTPPDTHALNFLERPNILNDFTEHKVMTWLIKPFSFAERVGIFKVLSLGERLMMGIAKVTGLDMLKKLVEFLVLMETTIEGFQKSGESLQRILSDSTTGFVIVAASTENSIHATLHLAQELRKLKYKLSALIINRTLPKAVKEEILSWKKPSEIDKRWAKALNVLLNRLNYETQLQNQVANNLRTLHHDNTLIFNVPEQENMIHTKDAACNLGKVLGEIPGCQI